MISKKNETIKTVLCLLILGLPILTGFLGEALHGWHYVFDDAFITFRYAKNLALGYGLTWNPHSPPTEGYTNFLLVLFLAPAIKLGLSPLSVTRLLSFFCAFLLAAFHFNYARRVHKTSTPAALMIGSIILFLPQTRSLCLVGLETVIYSFFLLWSAYLGIRFIQFNSIKYSIHFSISLIFTMLLRPEAFLLCPTLLLSLYLYNSRKLKSNRGPLLLGIAALAGLGGSYLLWKFWYFGDFLPNPFYIKVAGSGYYSKIGAGSVLTFLSRHALIISISLGAFAFSQCSRRKSREVFLVNVFSLLFLGIYSAFFFKTDTLMDIHGRFMFPVISILILGFIPLIASIVKKMEDLSNECQGRYFVFILAFLCCFGPADIHIHKNLRLFKLSNDWATSNSLMQKELRIAKKLAEYPFIEKTKIAFGDSGVIPYFTNSIWLDVAGLNDSFIARTKNRNQLVDYFFKFQADLVMTMGNKDFTWCNYGHGILGDFTQWAKDPRWDNYSYVGTSKIADAYDIHYFVNNTSSTTLFLKGFITEFVIDGFFDPVPFLIGTFAPAKDKRFIWNPCRGL